VIVKRLPCGGGRRVLDAAGRQKLFSISPAMIDCVLAPEWITGVHLPFEAAQAPSP